MTMIAEHPREQLTRIYGPKIAQQTIDKVIAFRAMHSMDDSCNPAAQSRRQHRGL